jgi:hypothetical protein
MKAGKGLSKKSTSPTRMLEASAPFGIFFMKFRFVCAVQRQWKLDGTDEELSKNYLLTSF